MKEERFDAEFLYKREVLNSLLKKHENSLIQKELTKGIKGTLIYGFGRKEADILDDSIYYCEDGFIRYKILDEAKFLNDKPEATIENHYAIIELEVFLSVIEPRELEAFFLISENVQFNLKEIGLMKW